MKARVFVMPKDGVLDPQGKAIAHALGNLGFSGVGEVRDASDAMLLTLQNFGHASVAYLRQTLGRRDTSGLPRVVEGTSISR